MRECGRGEASSALQADSSTAETRQGGPQLQSRYDYLRIAIAHLTGISGYDIMLELIMGCSDFQSSISTEFTAFSL